MEGLTKVWAQLRDIWGKIGPRLRAGLIAVLVGSALIIGIVTVLAGGPKRVLFSGLDPHDAAAIVGALDGAKIPYDLDAGGTVIRVASGDVDRARLMLAEQDLPKSGNVGFEMFAEQSFGLTEFAQKVNYRRALQGELERTIGALDPVASARVHITQPDRAVFADERTPPTASVTVDLRSGRTVSDRQVGAIRHLVSSAVEGLSAGDVTVVTTDGALLSKAGVDEASGAALDYQTDLERDLEKRLSRLLERTVGVGGVEVTVAAQVDFSRTDTTEESFDPEQSAIRSEALQESHEGAGANRPAGIAGAPANQVDGPTAGFRNAGDEASQLIRSRNYEINRTVVHTVGPTATVRRLTVAVLVDGHYAVPEGEGEPVFTPRSESELAELQAVIENAMGFNAARGDRVKIASVEFRDRSGDAAGEFGQADNLPPWLIPAAAGGGLALIALTYLLVRRRKPQKTVTPEVLQLPTPVTTAEAALARLDAGGAAAHENPALTESGENARQRVLQLASADPERTADIIRGWLKADQAS